MSNLRLTFDALSTANVVRGPTLDGGYYLIGSCQPQPALFNWERRDGTTLCRETQARAEAYGARVTLLPSWYDIDTREDVERLVDDLLKHENGARHARRFLARERLL